MSDDWVKNYIQGKKNKQRKADLAEAGALALFQKIEERVQQDLQEFHDAGLFRDLTLSPGSRAGRFGVSSTEEPPQAALAALLNIVLIECRYAVKNEKPYSVTLKICADLDGNLLVYKDGKMIAEESDVSPVSECLLRCLLKPFEN